MASANKRGPTVLVTDARDARPRTSHPSRPADLARRTSSRLITVDNVLQYASDIPSAQARTPLGQRPVPQRTRSGRPSAPRLAGRVVHQASVLPARSTKVSEKLVLLPDTQEEDEDDEEEKADYAEDNELAPERDSERERRRHSAYKPKKGKSYAERLPKSRREEKLSRCTAYCTAQAYKLQATATFLRDQAGARTKLYDDCLYAVFHLPLLPGTDGYRVRSSPVIKSPGGKAVLDEQIERSEARDYAEGYFEPEDEAETYSVRGDEDDGDAAASPEAEHQHRNKHHAPSNGSPRRVSSPPPRSDAGAFAEMFVFAYGVVVFWNFTAREEKDVLADLTFHSTDARGPTKSLAESLDPTAMLVASPKQAVHPLALSPLPDSEFETEEFHFEYAPSAPRPRVYNDMITLRSPDHMIKLAISHAIAQSTKLSLFEQRMASQMESASPIPRRLALSGELGLARRDVLRILGALYRTRVEVNLSEPVLDTPQFFWQSEPPLHPLYAAVREYLEISPRVKVLNERCGVFLDLAEMLGEGVADARMNSMTWGIILLIAVSIVVTCTEVFLRFGLLSASGSLSKTNGTASGSAVGVIDGGVCVCPPALPSRMAAGSGPLLGAELLGTNLEL